MDKRIKAGINWFQNKNWEPFPFQIETWESIVAGHSGLLNAPTGSGKTYALWVGYLISKLDEKPTKGLKFIWILPLRALSKDIQLAMQEAAQDFGFDWKIEIRTGDTSIKDRQRQKKTPPDCLITTPESLHLLLSQKNSTEYFKNLEAIVVDEWHELLGSKRGVQVELALSSFKKLSKNKLKIWGISATIGNLSEAQKVLLGQNDKEGKFISANLDKEIKIESILPDEVEKYPWAGHLGIKLIDKVLPIIHKNKTTLIFTNTRSQTEIWYQQLLNKDPELAGAIAMHHGSLNNQIRVWVEEALHSGQIKVVVCTSSLDLGVDFRPVDTIIQVGGPKGVARFAQRAGRSGHRPGEISKIYFLPTHSLELIEGAALRTAIKNKEFEARIPIQMALDVLLQFMITLAVGDGFDPEKLYLEIKTTFCYQNLNKKDWNWLLNFLKTGGESLSAYDEYQKTITENGLIKVVNKRMAMRHRLSIGTIVGDQVLNVKYVKGGHLGTIEEYFISKLKPGDVFWFSGKPLEYIRLKDMTVQVRKSKRTTGQIPQWMGGRMPLSSQLSYYIKQKLEKIRKNELDEIELLKIHPLIKRQMELSTVPKANELLIESTISKEGFHIFIFPFEGRFIHEVLAGLIAYRISVSQPITFSIAINDYGLELLTDEQFDFEEMLSLDLFSMENIKEDVLLGINETEMAKRKFRDIASISGLIFRGFPGKNIKEKHIQASSSILFDVFTEYEPKNLLLLQAHREVIEQQLEQERLMKSMQKINQQKIIYIKTSKPTPFAFPIMVDRLREKFSTETIEERVAKMQLQLENI
ncbi:DNA ligase-associated DEXH box helicase [Marivirga tractuosa]|uniref:ATP dependent helicase, Lhr family n=1 Tax=Marivirga tractuosa (strain ATCC 23168 / DSM 4126 / NBRC 15989 / NCIMB 1408 / VKM B-1430 / H-43) TaxID=643867 RepID=E4TS22_MARTH|nr:ligase-associated DNA damage response DEXH box helicase [Marivirga tractuosa]ADR20773.1 ATP dependent helicase, Lhr family [Marivirga tractuosa DSM 4126]BDD14776.1 DNA ligase-associated DEXH box helicase [Marivirga tractuosa]